MPIPTTTVATDVQDLEARFAAVTAPGFDGLLIVDCVTQTPVGKCGNAKSAASSCRLMNSAYATGKAETDAALFEVLKSIEWGGTERDEHGDEVAACPHCGAEKSEGHHTGCPLAAVLIARAQTWGKPEPVPSGSIIERCRLAMARSYAASAAKQQRNLESGENRDRLAIKAILDAAGFPELHAAADNVQCCCSVAERDSGHRVGCWMPALEDALDKAGDLE